MLCYQYRNGENVCLKRKGCPKQIFCENPGDGKSSTPDINKCTPMFIMDSRVIEIRKYTANIYGALRRVYGLSVGFLYEKEL